jgi:nicotinamide mononucleotide adenylyltransferase
MNKIIELLPKKKDISLCECSLTLDDRNGCGCHIDDYNKALSDCIAAIEKAKIGVVPSEEEIAVEVWKKFGWYYHGIGHEVKWGELNPQEKEQWLCAAKAIRNPMLKNDTAQQCQHGFVSKTFCEICNPEKESEDV